MVDDTASSPLRDLLTTTKDGDWGKESPEEGFVPYRVIRGTDFPRVRFGDISSVPLRYLSESTVRRRTLEPDDILIETAGGSPDRPTGRSLLITERVLSSFKMPVTCASFARFLRIDRKKADPRFVYWYLQHLYANGVMEEHQVQHTGVARFQYTKFAESVRIPLPALSEQCTIAHILGSLDDKIELNRRMNETLEAMARAIFKSWFVDFEPIRAKAEGRDPGLPKYIANLFPNRIEDSELGEIPAGWRIASLEHLCRHIAMGPFGSDIKTDNFVEAGVPVIRGGNLTNGFVDEEFVFVSEQKADELRNANAFSGDIVITHRGTLGQVGLIPRRSRFPRYVVSQSQMVLSANPSVATPCFLFEYLCSPDGQNQLLANTSQTGVPAIARPTTSLKAIRLVCPPFDVLQSFETLISPLSDRAITNQLECRTLTALRDSLLPKLLSGEVRVGKFDFTPDLSKNVSNA
jgi:restriction endonuclease S subunit